MTKMSSLATYRVLDDSLHAVRVKQRAKLKVNLIKKYIPRRWMESVRMACCRECVHMLMAWSKSFTMFASPLASLSGRRRKKSHKHLLKAFKATTRYRRRLISRKLIYLALGNSLSSPSQLDSFDIFSPTTSTTASMAIYKLQTTTQQSY